MAKAMRRLKCRVAVRPIMWRSADRSMLVSRGRDKRASGRRGFLNDSDIDNHVVAEVLVSGDESYALVILEADAL